MNNVEQIQEARRQRLWWERRLEARTKALCGSGIAHKGQMTFNDIIEKEAITNMATLKEMADASTMGHVIDLGSIPTNIEV